MMTAAELRAALDSVEADGASDREWEIVIGAAKAMCDVAEAMAEMNAPSPLAVVPYFNALPAP